MKQGATKYIKSELSLEVYFTEEKMKCRFCPFCIVDQFNRYREICFITKSTLPHADLSIEGNCPLKFEQKEDGTNDG